MTIYVVVANYIDVVCVVVVTLAVVLGVYVVAVDGWRVVGYVG